MSDVKVGAGGVTVGDWTFGVAPATSTDAHLDTVEGRERALGKLQQEEQARAAGDVAPAHPITNPLGPRTDVVPVGEDGEVDESIAAARAANQPADAPMPIILRDPVTGEPIATE
jgi:hypothetical protein